MTRHQDRFVALVPAAGFPRRRAIVHDVSASGQSLFVEPLEICESNNRSISRICGSESNAQKPNNLASVLAT